jgi:AsmA protein
VKFLSSKRRRFAASAVIFLLLFLLHPGASRLKSRIIVSMSSAVGRSVDIGAVHLRLLPRPGFDLENLVVYDDPAYGAEPMLRANEVTASLRLTSLLRGRIEIARLDLTEPSLNLVHGDNGRWNLEALVERTAHIPLAPTAKAKSEPRPGFPYIEATSARINFKNGREKKAFALTNADFSLWQDSENTWGVRLNAQPVRTDMSLNDIGVLRVNGTWQRAATLRETPLNFHVEWRRAQLGQLTKLFTHNDQGWRGGVDVDATLSGTPAKLAVSTNAAIQDFRRYDLTNGEGLRLGAHCDGEYSSLDHVFHQVVCSAPVQSGIIALKGELGLPGSHRYNLMLMARDVPASALIALAQRAKKTLPDDLTTGGTLRGNVEIASEAGSPLRVQGRGEIEDFLLVSATNKAEIGPETIPFIFRSTNLAEARTATNRRKTSAIPVPQGAYVELGPIPIATGRTATAVMQGWADRSGCNFALKGETQIATALRVARLAGIPALNTTADGAAQLDLQIAGAWPEWGSGTSADFQKPQITGTAKLRNVRVLVRGTGEPGQIGSADLQLGPEETRVEKLKAIVADELWTGSLDVPRGCGTPGACEIRFDLRADRIALPELSNWVSPRPKQQPWYRVLESSAPTSPSFLGSLRAAGHIAVDRLQGDGLTATRVSANVDLDSGKLQISELTADLLGGSYEGTWQADFIVKPAVCRGSGSVSGLQLARLEDAGHTPQVSGTANGSYQISGPCGTLAESSSSTSFPTSSASNSSFWTSSLRSADGSLQFDVQDGLVPHVSLAADEGPLRFERLSGQARLRDGKLDLKDARLNTQDGKFLLSGTASLQSELELKLVRSGNGAGGYAITGTLAEPRVTALPGPEQARLKTEVAK